MVPFVKRSIYTINILTAIYIIIWILFSANHIRATYSRLIETSYKIEKEYCEFFDKYNGLITFILKNKLPQNINYFNLAGNTIYNLPPIKELQILRAKNIKINKNNTNNVAKDTIVKCYDSNCMLIRINERELLNQILKNIPLVYNGISAIPASKAKLLQISFRSFLEAHKLFLFNTLAYLFILYLTQSLFLFRKNCNLVETNASLVITSDKAQKDLNKQLTKYNILYDSTLSTIELTDEYFTYYIHQLLARNICIEKTQITNILHRIEKLFNYQLIKKDLKIVLDNADGRIVFTDNEIVFLILLSLFYKAIQRSKTSTEITIKVSQVQGVTNIEINDTGYEYEAELSNKVQTYNLPKPILEKLCQKAKTRIVETRKHITNIINLEIIDLEDNEDAEEIHETTDKIIRVRLTQL